MPARDWPGCGHARHGIPAPPPAPQCSCDVAKRARPQCHVRSSVECALIIKALHCCICHASAVSCASASGRSMPSSGLLCERFDQLIESRSRIACKLTGQAPSDAAKQANEPAPGIPKVALLQRCISTLFEVFQTYQAAAGTRVCCCRKLKMRHCQLYSLCTSQWLCHHAGRPYLSPGLAVWTMRAFRNLPGQWSCEMHEELCVSTGGLWRYAISLGGPEGKRPLAFRILFMLSL